MSDFSLTLVLQIKTSKIINDMAKVQQKSEKITAFGGIFFVLDKFDRILSSVIDSHLGLRSTQTGWTTVEIGFQQYDVQSFPFESFGDVKYCRLVVQRQRKQKGEQLDIFDGEYTYRCILTNDWDMTDSGSLEVAE